MQCGHCGADYHPNTTRHGLGADASAQAWQFEYEKCPRCQKWNARLVWGLPQQNNNFVSSAIATRNVYPKNGTMREPAPTAVPTGLQEDYNEACLVLADSPKASAALSRRCLQNILRECAKVKPQNLNKEIDDVISSNQLPSHLASDLHAIRVVGNFAAHPTKDTSTGEIVNVEPGEAEWLLDLVMGLFDFYFVAPAETKKRRDALNEKLKPAGKPPI